MKKINWNEVKRWSDDWAISILLCLCGVVSLAMSAWFGIIYLIVRSLQGK